MHSSSADTKSVLRRFENAMNARQLDLLDEVLAPDFVRHCQATPALDIRSLDQFKAFLKQDLAMFPDNIQTFTHILVESWDTSLLPRASLHHCRAIGAPRVLGPERPRIAWRRSRPRCSGGAAGVGTATRRQAVRRNGSRRRALGRPRCGCLGADASERSCRSLDEQS